MRKIPFTGTAVDTLTCTVSATSVDNACTSTGAPVAFAANDAIAIKSSGTSTVSPRMSWTAIYTIP